MVRKDRKPKEIVIVKSFYKLSEWLTLLTALLLLVSTTVTLADGRQIPHVNHVVQPNETLFGIAEKYYGNGYEWVHLQEYNRVEDPDHLAAGSTIFVPNPKLDPSEHSHQNPGSVVTNNPSKLADLPAFFIALTQLNVFGMSFYKILICVAIWFMLHSMIQGAFVWFAAHMAFIKDVSLRKAMRATFQSESLATVLLFILAVMGLLVVFFDNGPPAESLASVVATVESHLTTEGGMLAAGAFLVLLYVFLGIRFIPQAFQTSSGQGFAVVIVSILLPHSIFLYLLGSRFGFI